MNVSSAVAIERLQHAALLRQKYKGCILDVHLQNNYRIQRLMHALYEEQGTVTEFQQILGQLGVLKWKESADGQNG